MESISLSALKTSFCFRKWPYRRITRLLACLACILPSNAFAITATSLSFTVNTSEAVTIDTSGGTPRIALDVGGTTRYATYASGSGGSALVFTYTFVAGDVDLDGIGMTSPIQLNGGTIKDAAGNDATLTFTVPNTSGLNVDYYVGPLESLPAASATFSIRRLKRSYTGPLIRIRRSSDNTESNIGYLANGNLDITSLTSFCGSGSCFVKTWYDQSGNGRDATQTTTTAQPRIFNAGTLDTSNSRPTLVFNGSSQYLTASNIPSIFNNTLGGFVNGIGRLTSATATWRGMVQQGRDTAAWWGIWASSSNKWIGGIPTLNQVSTLDASSPLAMISLTQVPGSQYEFRANATTPVTATSSNASNASQLSIGRALGVTEFWNGHISEIIIIPQVLSSTDRQALETNEKTYFSTP